MSYGLHWISVVLFVVLSWAAAHATQPTLLDGGALSNGQSALIAMPNGSLFVARKGAPSTGPSLFVDRAAGGLFEIRVTPPPSERLNITGSYRPGIQGLRDLIGRAEAGRKGYDAVQYGARIKPGKLPTQMTLAEIYAWIEATPGQPHAIGMYQFIPKTLRSVAKRAGVPPGTRFSPKVQDLLADELFDDAGYPAFMSGRLSREKFMNNLAKIWAGFPNSSGKSHYHGFAGNHATITWAQFQGAMENIFPGRS